MAKRRIPKHETSTGEKYTPSRSPENEKVEESLKNEFSSNTNSIEIKVARGTLRGNRLNGSIFSLAAREAM
jgi:hypothetical protein